MKLFRHFSPDSVAVSPNLDPPEPAWLTEFAGDERRRTGRCRRLLPADGPLGAHPCGVPCEAVEIIPARRDRQAVRVACCDEHGGPDRARAEARRDWSVLAPDAVDDCLGAGCRALVTTDLVVLLRREGDERAGWMLDQWTVTIVGGKPERDRLRAEAPELLLRAGITQSPQTWSREAPARHATQTLTAAGVEVKFIHTPAHMAPTRPRKRPWLAALGVGSMIESASAHGTEAEATAAGLAAWRIRIARSIRDIRAARGGTLGWGIPVVAPDAPVVVRAEPGQCSWDALLATRRIALDYISGLPQILPEG